MTLKPFGHFLSDELHAGHIDFHVRAERIRADFLDGEREVIRFYIHPLNASGDTQDYFVVNDENASLTFTGQIAAALSSKTETAE